MLMSNERLAELDKKAAPIVIGNANQSGATAIDSL